MITRETTKRLLTAGGIIAAVIVIAGYAYFASSGFIEGPSITITSPSAVEKNGLIYANVSTSSIIISGDAVRVNSLVLDGRPIVIDTQGNFSETLLLFPGYNIYTLQGQDRFGRTTQINFEIEYGTQ